MIAFEAYKLSESLPEHNNNKIIKMNLNKWKRPADGEFMLGKSDSLLF